MFEVAVGDEVGYGRYHQWGTLLHHGFSQVVKINHHGHIHLENGRVFDRRGQERNRDYGGSHLMVAERLRAELQRIAEGRARAAAANELRKLIDDHRNGRGEQCAIGEDARAKMIALVNAL
jgi:hypothetical protein